MNNSTDVAS